MEKYEINLFRILIGVIYAMLVTLTIVSIAL